MKRRTRKRTLLTLLLLLTGGAIINVAVAWGFMNFEPVSTSIPKNVLADYLNDAEREWWDAHAPPTFAQLGPYGHGMKRSEPYRGIGYGVTSMMGELHDMKGASVPELCLVLKSGWPTLSLGGQIWGMPKTWTPQKSSYDYVLRDAFALTVTPIPESLSNPFFRLMLFRPIWPGLAINTIVYGATLWLIVATHGFVRRRIRARRGHCPACAYPIGTSNVCTECGKSVRIQKA